MASAPQGMFMPVYYIHMHNSCIDNLIGVTGYFDLAALAPEEYGDILLPESGYISAFKIVLVINYYTVV